MRFVSVLAEAGTIAEAARRLNVNRTTVQRRITAFEDQLEYRLFSRDGWGLEPLPEAAAILEAARQIGETLSHIERKTAGAEADLAGKLSVTTTDSIFMSHLGEVLAGFQRAYPSIILNLSISTRPHDLSRRESEVAIRPSLAPPEHLVGRRICDLTFHAYATPAYLERHPGMAVQDHSWIGMVERFRGAPTEIWMADHVPDEKVRFRADTYIAIAEAARHGLGIALLPSNYGDRIGDLERVEGLVRQRIHTGLWVLTHPDLRQSPRVRTLLDFLTDKLAASRQIYDA